MKLLVVSLALTIFAAPTYPAVMEQSWRPPQGSQAFVLKESDSKVAELLAQGITDAFSVSEAMRSNRETIEQSDIGKALRPWIDNRRVKIEERKDAFRDAIPSEVKEVYKQVATAVSDFWRKVENDLRTLIQKASRETEAFSEALVDDVNPTLEKLDSSLQTWRQRIVDVAADVNEKMVSWSLEKLKPFAGEIQSKLQEVQDSVDPYVDQVQASILIELGNAQNVLKQSASHILGIFNKHRESFNQWVQTPLYPTDH